MEFNSSYDQTNFMGYYPSSPISNGGWEYHPENTQSEHSNSWRFASEPQDEKENHMGYFPPPQNDASRDSNGGWEGNSNAPYDIHPKISSLDHASTKSPFQNLPLTQTSYNQRISKFESMLKRFAEENEKYQKEQENSLKNMEVHEISIEDEEKEAIEPKAACPQKPFEIKEHENSQPPQTPLDQNASTLESMIERYDEEMKKCWEDKQTSPMIELLKQMLGAKKGVEEHESEEVIPENSHSSEAENHMKEGLVEPPIQEALNEEITPIITQQPCLDIQEVKAIDKSTKKRIVTKIPRTTFMRRSTANNPPPDPASKLNQAVYKRRLVERRPRQGTITETSPLLESFLLTNWKKRKKVNNMSTVGTNSLLCFAFVLCFVSNSINWHMVTF
ncbi:hypothetical protein AHAS_Ahas04G0141700 [Arachis hypogaea]